MILTWIAGAVLPQFALHVDVVDDDKAVVVVVRLDTNLR